ncbi:M56 family metallopeptidase [uncultured Jatrophihabitans sp.]|uniref:M56 family metallopeptidase n=1 Tax=uncultured Jatrophihabitans sp. TaxID=1610747 RepID=UPI0035C96A7B
MTVLAVLPFALGLVLYRGAPWLGRWCDPAWAACALVVLALVSAVASGLVLCAVACLGLAELPGLARTGHWSATSLTRHTSVPLPVASVAAVVAAVLMAASVRQVVRAVGRLVAVDRAARALGPGHGGLVIVDDDHTGAYAVPGLRGGRGRTVVSRRLLRILEPAERRALLAHEHSHLRHRHVVHVQLAELAAAANPLLRPTARAVRRAVEQWADRDAVAEVGDPVPVARALAKAALARGRAPDLGLAAGETELAGRVRLLLEPVRRGTAGAVALMAGAAVLCAASSLTVAVHAHQDFERAQAHYAAGGRPPK